MVGPEGYMGGTQTVSVGGGKGESQRQLRGLPWWSSGWNSALTMQGPRFNPWSGKIPKQLSLSTTTTEAVHSRAHMLQPLETIHLEPMFCNKRSHHTEKSRHHNEKSRHRNEISPYSQGRPSAAENKY